MIVLLIYDVLDGVVYKGKTLRRIRSKYCFVVFSSMSSCRRGRTLRRIRYVRFKGFYRYNLGSISPLS